MLNYFLFLLFVAFAVYSQSVTGFALALILLGLVGITDLVPLPDAANVAMVLIIVNAIMFFYRRRNARIERVLVPAVGMTFLGVLAGMALLTFLAANAYDVLKMILGFSIIACAVLLWRASSPLRAASGSGYFAGVGLVSGVLGGLFAAPGPPMVYAVYRQPWPIERIQESLIFCFGLGSLVRLLAVIAFGDFSRQAMLLTVAAIPVTLIVTTLSVSYPPPVSQDVIKKAVSLLLVGSGLGMLVSSMVVLFG